MLNIDKSQPVLVTGATGYVAGWIVKELLEQGVDVHASVRNPDDAEKLKYLNAVAESAPGNITYFRADLLEPGSFKQAMAGCQVVFHTASPFINSVNDPQKELVDPALFGTTNVLNEAKLHESVQRVVLTSSVVAIYGDSIELDLTAQGKFTEEYWNTSSSLTHQPYSYSKVIAEKKAWEIAKSEVSWDMVVINPGLVLGPGVSPVSNSESYRIVKQLGDGSMKPGAPDLGLSVVDVRDLAVAHINAAFLPEAEGRHIVIGHNTNLLGMAHELEAQFGEKYPLPRKILPKWVLWLFGPMMSKGAISRQFISRNVGYPCICDNSKSIEKLGMTYRPLKETMVPMFEQMIENGMLKAKG